MAPVGSYYHQSFLERSWVALNEDGSAKSCVWKVHPLSKEHYLSVEKVLQLAEIHFDTEGYPTNRMFASEYLRFLDTYPGEIFQKDPSTFYYFRSSVELGIPGKVKVPGTEQYLRSLVECDLPRLDSLKINEVTIYEGKTKPPIEDIISELSNHIGDIDLTLELSKLITQATIADATVEFFRKFSNDHLNYLPLNAEHRGVVIYSKGDEIELRYEALFGIRDLAVRDIPPVVRYSLVTSQFILPKATLKNHTQDGIVHNIIFSPFRPYRKDFDV